MSCAEIKERTVDYLYGALSPGERSSFEAHLTGCSGCQGEVAGLQETLQHARGALRALDEAPPPRVRMAVLEAAHAHARATAAAETPPPRERMRPPRTEVVGGFWGWWRRPWVMPLVGAVALTTAIVVVAREVITNPSSLERPAARARSQASYERSSPPAPVSLAPAPTAVPAALSPAPANAAPPPREEAAEPTPSHVATAASRVRVRSAAGGASANARFAAPPASRPRAAQAGRAPSVREVDDDPLTGLAGFRAADKAMPPSAKGAGGAEPRPEEMTGRPERDRAADTMAKRAPAAPAEPEVTTTRSPPPAPKASRPLPQHEAESSPGAAFEEAERAPSKAKKAASNPDEMSQRTDRLFTAGRWAEAAAGYRELLRLYPQHPSVPRWKGRLRACELATDRR